VGLLYEITRGLFEAGMTISSAIVATYGELAVDTFYVRDIFGHKVIHPQRLAAIKARLMKALEG
jgi:[protein-PII] uridylyltransferase